MLFADGMGGVSIDALEAWFRPPNEGSRLDPAARRLVWRLVPELISEDREIAAEKRKKKK